LVAYPIIYSSSFTSQVVNAGFLTEPSTVSMMATGKKGDLINLGSQVFVEVKLYCFLLGANGRGGHDLAKKLSTS